MPVQLNYIHILFLFIYEKETDSLRMHMTPYGDSGLDVMSVAKPVAGVLFRRQSEKSAI
jgi:hypothetical protein